MTARERSRYAGRVSDIVERIHVHGLLAVVDAPVEDQLFDWAKAVAKGGIHLLGIPVWLPNVTEIASDLADEAGLSVGVTGVVGSEQVSIAMAAGAQFIVSPVSDADLVSTAKARGITVLAGATTPSEILVATGAGADMVCLNPVGVLGGVDYFSVIVRQFPHIRLLASGGVDIENAPAFLEAGAVAAIVDRGVFPNPNEPAAVEVITARALALTEVCADALGETKRHSLSELLGGEEG